MAKARVAGVFIICVMLLTMLAPQLATAAYNPTQKPTNVAPYDGATEIGPDFVFQFTYPDPAPDVYYGKQVQYRTADGDYNLPLFDSGWVAPSVVDVYPEGLFAYGQTYYWHVRVQDDLGNWTGWSDETSFTVIENSNPSMPENFEPDDGVTGVTLPVTLQGSEFRDPNAAELVYGERDTHAASWWQVTATSDNYSSPVFDSGRVTAALTSITIPLGALSENTTYYWHVKYQDSYGNWSAYSDGTSFAAGITAVADAVRKPVNISPYNGATEISPDQRLTASPFVGTGDRTHYASRWQVAGSDSTDKNEDGSYKEPLFDTSVDPNNKITIAMPVGLLEYGKTFYWHVKYQDSTGVWSDWSEETSFTVAENLAPSQPRNISPLDEAERVSIPVVLTASAFADPDSSAYAALTDSHAASRWQLRAEDGNYDDPLWDSDICGPTTAVTVPKGLLEAGKTYYWHVKYEDSRDNWSGYSAETSFTTKAISAPTAWFVADKTDVVAGQDLVTFTDNSTPLAEIERWVWNFDDGTTENWTSDTRPPNGEVSHKYTKGDTYTVTLTVYNGAAPEGKTKTMDIVVHAKPQASFTLTPSAPKAGKDITFTDASTPTADITSWEWQFDDGTVEQWTAEQRSAAEGKITHKFKTSGKHTVSLVVKGPLGESYYNKQVNVAKAGGLKFGLWMIGVLVVVLVLIGAGVYLIRARRAK